MTYSLSTEKLVSKFAFQMQAAALHSGGVGGTAAAAGGLEPVPEDEEEAERIAELAKEVNGMRRRVLLTQKPPPPPGPLTAAVGLCTLNQVDP
jgi:hypothetical protein